jgi:hypothetical protein
MVAAQAGSQVGGGGAPVCSFVDIINIGTRMSDIRQRGPLAVQLQLVVMGRLIEIDVFLFQFGPDQPGRTFAVVLAGIGGFEDLFEKMQRRQAEPIARLAQQVIDEAIEGAD